jgi:hypothetical protein
MSVPKTAPEWLLWPLPANASHDAKLTEAIDKHGQALTTAKGLTALHGALNAVQALATYEPAANHANALVWEQFETLVSSPDARDRSGLLHYAGDHLPPRALARVVRRLAKDPDMSVRRLAATTLRRARIQEVALPALKDGTWDASGWVLPVRPGDAGKITRHKTGKRVFERTGVPPLGSVEQLRALLNVKSAKQLGFFLLASDHKNGPYTTHTIPKRDGSDRQICAPKKQRNAPADHVIDE